MMFTEKGEIISNPEEPLIIQYRIQDAKSHI